MTLKTGVSQGSANHVAQFGKLIYVSLNVSLSSSMNVTNNTIIATVNKKPK